MRDIEKIFTVTKDTRFDDFITNLQNRSNSIFKKLNIDSFTGTIVFLKKNKGNQASAVRVELQENGRTFHMPNQALLTSMHISILFAIAQLAREFQEEEFPMIFDAPTSSFDESKAAHFLNLIFETENQKILLVKDFISTDPVTNQPSIKREFDSVKRDKAFWVRLERPFDPNDLKTINTNVIEY